MCMPKSLPNLFLRLQNNHLYGSETTMPLLTLKRLIFFFPMATAHIPKPVCYSAAQEAATKNTHPFLCLCLKGVMDLEINLQCIILSEFKGHKTKHRRNAQELRSRCYYK